MVVQRNTWQRERVREALADARGFVSAQSLHATLRDENTGIGLATVYRALAGLAAQGAADSLQSPDGESLYRACATRGHHHHPDSSRHDHVPRVAAPFEPFGRSGGE